MSSLSGITCVLDEPSFGLHPADSQRMTNIISSLHKNGNTIVMVDHSDEMISASHHAIEMGPGAGKEGGTIISEGNISDIKERLNTIRNSVKPLHCNIKPGIHIKNAFANNLKNISVEIPFGCFALITGASGSGKTTLLYDVVHSSLLSKKPIGCEQMNVLSPIGNNIYVEQEVSLGSSQSIPIIYTGIFDSVRKAFAAAANSRTFTHSHFSFHSKEGQCPACNGSGTHTVSLDFWSDAEIICEVCNGKRYKDDVLKVSIDGLNIAELLSITIKEFSQWYENNLPASDLKKFRQLLNYLNKVGLDYLSIGQSMNTLSTGEMQRLKLATALSGKMENNALILLDEPTGGLHPTDTLKIISLFEDILTEGHSIICVSHDPMLMKAAGWQLALGPGGGRFGGHII
jgi:excinuclease ABC subunit A